MTDREWMEKAVRLAQGAAEIGMRPFGSVVVDSNGRHVLGMARGTQTATDPICHSEVEAIREACRAKSSLLEGCTLFTTHEPCLMCAGAIVHSKLKRVVYGSRRSDLPELFRTRGYLADDLLQDHSVPTVVERMLVDECVALFADERLVHLARAVAQTEVPHEPITGGLLVSRCWLTPGECHDEDLCNRLGACQRQPRMGDTVHNIGDERVG